MSKCGPCSSVGSFYSRYENERDLGPVFIRETCGRFHVLKQLSENPGLFEIVADTGTNRELAEVLVDYLTTDWKNSLANRLGMV
jgi:hypothetical protein